MNRPNATQEFEVYMTSAFCVHFKFLRCVRTIQAYMADWDVLRSNPVRNENLAMFHHSSWAYEKLTKFDSERHRPI